MAATSEEVIHGRQRDMHCNGIKSAISNDRVICNVAKLNFVRCIASSGVKYFVLTMSIALKNPDQSRENIHNDDDTDAQISRVWIKCSRK